MLPTRGKNQRAGFHSLLGCRKTVLETALETEISEHFGYDKSDPAGRSGGIPAMVTTPRPLDLTNLGPVEGQWDCPTRCN